MTMTSSPTSSPTSTALLDRRAFFVKQRFGLLKLAAVFDIFDPSTGAQLGIAAERIGALAKLARLVIQKRFMPLTLDVREREGGPVLLTLRRGASFLRADVLVRDGQDREIGRFKSKLLSLGGGFHVLDSQRKPIAEINGDWKGWNFRIVATDGCELGTVTKKWTGLAKELLSSADNYLITLNNRGQLSRSSAMLLLAAGFAIDVVYKEK